MIQFVIYANCDPRPIENRPEQQVRAQPKQSSDHLCRPRAVRGNAKVSAGSNLAAMFRRHRDIGGGEALSDYSPPGEQFFIRIPFLFESHPSGPRNPGWKRCEMKRRHVVGSEIHRLRCARGWSRSRLALELRLAGWDISGSQLAEIESGLVVVCDYELFHLSRVFQIGVADLLQQARCGSTSL